MNQRLKLNPIQQRIADGMSPLAAVFTDHTCGEACWEAREQTCRCVCGGANHGVMRSPDGVRPQRTAKIDGLRYVLKATAVDCPRNSRRVPTETRAARTAMYNEAQRLNVLYGGRVSNGKPYWTSWDTNVRRAPARIRNATKNQLNWSELTSYRETIETIKARPHAPIEWMEQWPQLLWVREDIADQENDRADT